MSLRMTNLVYLMVRRIYLYCEIKHENPWEILFHSISAKLRSLDPTLLYCIASVWTILSIGGIKLLTLRTTKFGLLDGKVAVLVYMHCKITGSFNSSYAWQIPYLKSVSNTVSAQIYKIKVFRPYPVILYRLRLNHSLHWCNKIGVPRNDKILSI